MVSRLIGFGLLAGAAACATGAGSHATRQALAPQDGPKAHVYASYSGGITHRTVRTTFRTDKNAHVIVGRLGGDGRVEILYPETPQASTMINGGKTFAARSFSSEYDGMPQLYSYASRMPRSYGARVDSYDGRGNGFVFIIATQYPMFTEALDDHGNWTDSLEVDDYYSSYDPRLAIRDLAEVLTRGMPYSLDYADSFTTSSFTGYADAAMDCATMVSTFGYVGAAYQMRMMGSQMHMMGTPVGLFMGAGFDPFSSYFSVGSFGYSPYVGCAFDYDRRYLNYNGRRSGYFLSGGWGLGEGWGPRGVVPIPTLGPIVTPEPVRKTGFSTASRRPGFRNGNESGSAINVTRPRFDGPRQKPTPTSSWAPPIRETRANVDRNDRYERANSGNSSSGATGVTRTEGVTSRPTPPPPAPVRETREAPVSHKVPVVPDKPKDP